MPISLRAVFRRYCDHHFWIKRPGFALFGSDGEVIGYVDAVHHGISTVQVDGWTTCSAVSLSKPGAYDWQAPAIERPDVATRLGGGHARTGFRAQVTHDGAAVVIALRDGKSLISTPVPLLSTRLKRRAKLRLGLRFFWDCATRFFTLAHYAIAPSFERKQKAKRALRMVTATQNRHLDLVRVSALSAPMKPSKVTIIVPVYNAFDTLKDCLKRVVKNTDVPWRLVVIEDCSTDKNVRPWLANWVKSETAKGHEIELFLNDKNLGFIASVNRGLKAARSYEDHVVLLNSDALVPPDWASRLLHPIIKNSSVASVTPFSNDAEIMTAPVMCRPCDVFEGRSDVIDQGLRGRISIDACTEIPTGVGFCMALNAAYLRRVPGFDPAFGKGYGEEVDWCQKTRALGGVHVAQPALFVEHKGGASFGSSAKQLAIQKNNAIVSSRYPAFDGEVQNFIASDPLRTARMIAAISVSCAQQSRLTIFIAHSMGGGAEMYLQEKVGCITSRGNACMVLRVGGAALWGIEHHSPNGILIGTVESNSDVTRLLSGLRHLDIIYSCGVGHPDPASIPMLLSELAEEKSNTLRILIHDYFCISEAYTLLNNEMRFTGINPLGQADTKWRASWRLAIDAAREVVCFSQASHSLMRDAYPAAGKKITVKPHNGFALPKPVNPTVDGRIGVLGDIGAQKGASLVSRLTRMPKAEQSRQIVIVGRLDPAFACGSSGVQVGTYDRQKISDLATKHRLECWLIPSIWPETFSYTTHEALATGLPVFVFDLGGQADVAGQAPNGHLMPLAWADDPERVAAHINGVLKDGAERRRHDQRPQRRRRRGFAA